MKEKDDLITQRKEKIEQLYCDGINPYPNKYDYTHTADEVFDKFSDIKEEQESQETVKVAGRIIANRKMGKACFSHLKTDSSVAAISEIKRAKSDKIQIYMRKDIVGDEQYQLYKKLDIGDFIGVEGKIFRTKTGELTVKVNSFILLSKSLRPLPEKWHGLKDVETRYRQRYVDLIVNQDVKEVFIKRSRIVKTMREFLDDEGFLEVETPMMQSIAGGATARPFVTHHKALGMDLFLRIAPELYLKRLIIGGISKVYEINRNFRNEGLSKRHNPEFTMLELYQAYLDYEGVMNLCEEMMTHVVQKVLGTLQVQYQGQYIDFSCPWQKLTLTEAIKKYTDVDFSKVKDADEAKKIAKSLNVSVEDDYKLGKIINRIVEECVEPKLLLPTFIIDYPVDISPLAKSKPDDPDTVERFELYIGGQEVANAYSELNDPQEQRKRMLAQAEERQSGDDEAQMLDEDYLRAMEYGMPPCGGLGIGIDRLVMLLTDSATIRDVIFFPQMRKEVK
ncbi:MAG: lysine--tRNA ligase [bacterium]